MPASSKKNNAAGEASADTEGTEQPENGTSAAETAANGRPKRRSGTAKKGTARKPKPRPKQGAAADLDVTTAPEDEATVESEESAEPAEAETEELSSPGRTRSRKTRTGRARSREDDDAAAEEDYEEDGYEEYDEEPEDVDDYDEPEYEDEDELYEEEPPRRRPRPRIRPAARPASKGRPPSKGRPSSRSRPSRPPARRPDGRGQSFFAANRLRIVGAVVVLIVIGALTANVLLWMQSNDLQGEKDTRQAVMTRAGEFGAALFTSSYKDVDGYQANLKKLIGDDMSTQLEELLSPQLQRLFVEEEKTSKGAVRRVFLGDVTEDKATAVVVMDAQTTTKTAIKEQKGVYIQLDLAAKNDQWLVVAANTLAVVDEQLFKPDGTPVKDSSELQDGGENKKDE